MSEVKEHNPKYKLDHFEGPLDLLLFLIRKNEVSIYDIPVSDITEQYLEFLKYSSGINLDDVSDFYLMAATLLYIKSRMLLPVEVDLEDELEDPRQELVQRLIEYEKYRKLTDLMAEREARAEWIVERKQTQPVLPFPDEGELWEKVGTWDLLKSFSKVMKDLGGERVISLWEEVTINEKITLINEFLEDQAEFSFDCPDATGISSCNSGAIIFNDENNNGAIATYGVGDQQYSFGSVSFDTGLSGTAIVPNNPDDTSGTAPTSCGGGLEFSCVSDWSSNPPELEYPAVTATNCIWSTT